VVQLQELLRGSAEWVGGFNPHAQQLEAIRPAVGSGDGRVGQAEAVRPPERLSMSQQLAGAGFGQAHQMFNLQIMIQFGLLIRAQGGGFLALQESPNPLARFFGRLEFDHLARAKGSDKLNNFFVRSQVETFALTGKTGGMEDGGSRIEDGSGGWLASSESC